VEEGDSLAFFRPVDSFCSLTYYLMPTSAISYSLVSQRERKRLAERGTQSVTKYNASRFCSVGKVSGFSSLFFNSKKQKNLLKFQIFIDGKIVFIF